MCKHKFDDDAVCILCGFDGAEAHYYSERGYAHEYEDTEHCPRHPDWFDLNDWILLNHPVIYDATKYLSAMDIQYSVWIAQWKLAGCPLID